MAYNFKNALVNLNEEIRKNNSGGDLPAVKLAVSQLQVSMAAVKSSVSNVSAQVAQIQETLASLNPSTNERIIGKWIDGTTDLYAKDLHVTSLGAAVSIPSGLTDVTVHDLYGFVNAKSGGNTFGLPLPYSAAAGQFIEMSYVYSSNSVGIGTGGSFTDVEGYVTLVYTKNTVQKKGR